MNGNGYVFAAVDMQDLKKYSYTVRILFFAHCFYSTL